MDKKPKSVIQEWVSGISMMQQSVLLTAVRGPDGIPKYHAAKYIIRWFRRSILLSSFAGVAILNPWEGDGGSFYGPSCEKHPLHDDWEKQLEKPASDYLKALDELPHHFQMHMMHAAEIVGYKHPDLRVRAWWREFYERLAHDMHLWPETEEQLDRRLGDSRQQWLERADVATTD